MRLQNDLRLANQAKEDLTNQVGASELCILCKF